MVVKKMLRLIQETPRIGNRAEVTQKFRHFMKGYYTDTGEKRIEKWNYNSAVLEDGPSHHLVHSTNSSESINAIFNNRIVSCRNLEEVIKEIKSFKSEQITRFYESMELGHYRKAKKTTKWKHQRLVEAVTRYNALDIIGKQTELHDTILTCGWLMCKFSSKSS